MIPRLKIGLLYPLLVGNPFRRLLFACYSASIFILLNNILSMILLVWLINAIVQLEGSVKEPNKFHIYEIEKITRKASDAAEYIELFGSFTQNRHAWRIKCYSLNVCQYIRRRASRSRVKEPNNTL